MFSEGGAGKWLGGHIRDIVVNSGKGAVRATKLASSVTTRQHSDMDGGDIQDIQSLEGLRTGDFVDKMADIA